MSVTLDMVKSLRSRYQQDFIYIKDMNSRYIYANENFLSFYQMSNLEQIYDKTDHDLPWHKYAEQYIRHDHEAINIGKLQVIEETVASNGRDVILILSHKYAFCDPKTKQSGMMGISVELTNKALKDFGAVVDMQELNNVKFSNILFSIKVNQHAQIPLTARELDVFYYILHGLSQKQVATKLNLSVRTVEDYIDHIKIKLHCHHKHQLFEFAINAGLMNIIPRQLDVNAQHNV